ncbi:unnamed protein product [Paramecium primaurelia]|uniref:Uncharacterized protein n=1 Tax=Paramecium primaurelia TaxID=5886 RepID=A0A8S1PEW9_PARPR|nr:unnamed protein product [Paramecium primaurelia]
MGKFVLFFVQNTFISALTYFGSFKKKLKKNKLGKIALFVCIADKVLRAKQYAEPQFQAIQQLVKSGFSGSIYFTQNEDMTQLEYYENLNDALLNCIYAYYIHLNQIIFSKFESINKNLNRGIFFHAKSDQSLTSKEELIIINNNHSNIYIFL